MLELTVRLVFSLAAVLGLLMLLARFGSRRFRGTKEALVQIVHKQHLTRGSTVSVVTVGSRVLVLGTTEHQVRVLAELDPEELADHLAATAPTTTDEAVFADELDDLTDLDGFDGFDDLDAAVAARQVARPVPLRSGRPKAGTANGPLSGSVLSVDTWRQALAVATRRAS